MMAIMNRSNEIVSSTNKCDCSSRTSAATTNTKRRGVASIRNPPLFLLFLTIIVLSTSSSSSSSSFFCEGKLSFSSLPLRIGIQSALQQQKRDAVSSPLFFRRRSFISSSSSSSSQISTTHTCSDNDSSRSNQDDGADYFQTQSCAATMVGEQQEWEDEIPELEKAQNIGANIVPVNAVPAVSVRRKSIHTDEYVFEDTFSASSQYSNNNKNNNNYDNTPTTEVLTIRNKVVKKRKQQEQIKGTTQARPLTFFESMIAGAASRTVSQTIMQPANTMKTILQTKCLLPGISTAASTTPFEYTVSELIKPKYFKMLTRGAGANFVMSIPHGAVNFAVLETVRNQLSIAVKKIETRRNEKNGGTNTRPLISPGLLDFMSSAVSTTCCSIVSTPQMMITDNIMAGNYPNLPKATTGLWKSQGFVKGFYSGWWPGLVGKIPSYGLTWVFFQELKRVRAKVYHDRPATNAENTLMGCIASGSAVCLMIPMDTIKTRLVTQASAVASSRVAYKGIIDCGVRVFQEEGLNTFYRGLYPRLFSVVPMMGIQFGVYEFMKKIILERDHQKANRSPQLVSATTTTTTNTVRIPNMIVPKKETAIIAMAAAALPMKRIRYNDQESLFITSSYV